MRSKLLQAVLACTTRTTRGRPSVGMGYVPPPAHQLVTFVAPLTPQPLQPFVRGAQAPLIVRAAILSQARCLHRTPALSRKSKRKKNKNAPDMCEGRTARRHQGFNKMCPPPPPKCPPQCVDDEECKHGFGSKRKRSKHQRHHRKGKH